MKTALILFAHGARDPEWAAPMRRVQQAVRRQVPEQTVELAFLEFMAPNLVDCATALVADGAEKIVVLPMFIARGGHLKQDVPLIIEQLRSTHPGVEFSLAGAVGEQELVIEAMATAALRMTGATFA